MESNGLFGMDICTQISALLSLVLLSVRAQLSTLKNMLTEYPGAFLRVPRSNSGAQTVLALLVCVLYANTLTNELVYDDFKLIPTNSLMHDPWDVAGIFAGGYWGEVLDSRHYRPLTVWSIACNYSLNESLGLPGAHVVGFHLINLLLHATASVLLYRWLCHLNIAFAVCCMAALLFAAHPIHTEAVTFITGRAEPLSAIWGFLFLTSHMRGRILAAGAALLLALLSKESAAVLPLLAFWVDWCWAHRWQWKTCGIYVVLVGFWAFVRARAVGEIDVAISILDNRLVGVGGVERWLTAATIQAKYLGLQILPVGLSSDYSYAQIPLVDSPFHPEVLVFGGLLITAFVAAVHCWRLWPLLPMALGGYTLTVGPTSNFLLLIPTIMAERLTYFPSAFFCVLASTGLCRLRLCWGYCGWIPPAILLISWSLLTIQRNTTWADAHSFYRAQYKEAPNSARAHLGMGKMHAQAGRLDSAAVFYRNALAIFPEYATAWYNLGLVETRWERWSTALNAYQQALAIEPGYGRALYNLGGVYLQLGNLPAALAAFTRLTKLSPENADAWNGQAVVYLQSGNLAGARRALDRVLALDPRHPSGLHNVESLRQRASAP